MKYMKYKLGLDLGSTSLGWAVVELGQDDQIIRLVDMGVRIFPDGQEHEQTGVRSLASVRAEKRQQRVQNSRKKKRRKQLLAKLITVGLLPDDKFLLSEFLNPGAGNDNKTNPYKLRSDAIEKQISLYELGRVLWHLSKHRGYSGKRNQDVDVGKNEKRQEEKSDVQKDGVDTQKEVNDVNKRVEVLRSDIAKEGCETLGQYLYKKCEKSKYTASLRFTALDANVGQSSGFPSRKLYQEEFDKIWDVQQGFYPDVLTDKLKQELCDEIIYFQRPLARQEPGKCKFEQEENRVAKWHPLYQEYRILQDVNNLELDGKSLSDEHRLAIYHMLMNPNAVKHLIDDNCRLSFEKIREHLNLTGRFNLEQNGNRGLLCNKTSKIMSADSVFGEVWFEFGLKKQEQIVSEITAYYKTKEESKKCLCEMGIHDEVLLDRLIKKHSSLTKGYSDLSAKAIEKVLPLMKDGAKWHEAAIKIYGKHTVIRPYHVFGYNPPRTLPDYRKLFPESLTNGKIGNVTVHIGLNQLRLLVNAIIEKYGHPYSIVIEMARDLKMGKKALAAYKRRQWQNQQDNILARREVNKALGRSYDSVVSAGEMERYKVWKNLHPKNDIKRYDYYDSSNEPIISLRDALSPEYEIEHIIPRAVGGDDTWANKILTKKSNNLAKGSRLPYQYLTPVQLERAKSWAREADDARKTEAQRKEELRVLKEGKVVPFVFCSFAWRFEADAEKHINKEFKARDLNDTRYLCKVARDYLSYICIGYSGGEKQRLPNVIASNGSMTSLFKDVWGVNGCLPVDYDKWSVQNWQRDIIEERIVERLYNEEPDFNPKRDKKRIEAELKNISDDEFMKVSSRKKDRTNHYHHALDAFVIACVDNKMVYEINSRADDFAKKRDEDNKSVDDVKKEKTLQQVRKEFVKKRYPKPFESYDDMMLAGRMNDLIVSEKQQPDKLEQYLSGKSSGFTGLTKDTAYGIADEKYFNNGKIKLRTSGKDSIADLETLVPVFNRLHSGYKKLKRQYIAAYSQWRKDKKNPDKISSLLSTISKDKVFKWLGSDGNYATEIYTNGKSDVWSSDIMSNWWALQRKGRFWWQDDFANGKRIMKLRIGSKIRVRYQNADSLSQQNNIGKWVKSQIEHKRDLFFKVKKLSGGKIFLTPIHVALERPDDSKSWQSSAAALKRVCAEHVDVSVLGDVIELK